MPSTIMCAHSTSKLGQPCCVACTDGMNYSNMSPEEQDAELARVRAFSRALFYNIRGDEDR
eukprot:scaffold215374_cov23-Tisochrysis_lutea.AAC.1